MTKQEMQDLTTDELLDLIDELPIRTFGYREFEALKQAKTAFVSDNYSDNMTVIEIETDQSSDAHDVVLLYNDTKDYGFKEPVFIG